MATRGLSITLTELEARLGARVPDAYRELVRSEPAHSFAKRGFDPKTLLILNLELDAEIREADNANRFFLNGDGCGNYYFVEPAVHPERVLLWSHDPPGIEDPELSFLPYVQEAEQERRIDWPVPPDHLCVCLTDNHAESILAPIQLADWIAVVEETEGIEYLGYREGKNPFTNEVIRVASPGLVGVLGRPRVHIRFFHGRALLDVRLAPIGVELARKLGAKLLGRTHE